MTDFTQLVARIQTAVSCLHSFLQFLFVHQQISFWGMAVWYQRLISSLFLFLLLTLFLPVFCYFLPLFSSFLRRLFNSQILFRLTSAILSPTKDVSWSQCIGSIKLVNGLRLLPGLIFLFFCTSTSPYVFVTRCFGLERLQIFVLLLVIVGFFYINLSWACDLRRKLRIMEISLTAHRKNKKWLLAEYF